jgi:hypothetical protein
MDFKDLLTSRNIIIFIIVLILIVAIFYYSKSKRSLEKLTNPTDTDKTPSLYPTSASGDAPFKTTQTTGLDKPDSASSLPDRTATSPNDLLPNTASANWGNLYPVQNDSGVYVPSMISPEFSIGINTISNTLKNPSLDLRSNIPIVKQVISPFNNSSWDMDVGKIGLDPSPSIMA